MEILEIKKANKNHLLEVEEISVQAFGHLGWAPMFFEEEIKKNEHFFYVALSGHEVVGFVNFMKTEGELGEDFNILNVATKASWLRMGVATSLLQFVHSLAKDKNFKCVWLEVRDSNKSAISLYEKLGYKFLYKRKNYYSNGEDALIYRLVL